MVEIIPIKMLYKYLHFEKEPLREWDENTDILNFLYDLYDKSGIISINNEEEIIANYKSYGKTVYNRGKERLSNRINKMKEVAEKNNTTAPAAKKDKVEVINFAEDPMFGWAGKYIIAWDGIIEEVLSEDAFFSIAHVLESESDLNCSIGLVTNLYYRQACQVLRNFLIDLTASIYFCDNQEEFERWKNNDYEFPPLTGEEGLINELVNRNILPQKTGERIKKLNDDLSDYVYGQESCLINKGMDSDDWLGYVFKKKDFYKWCEFLAETVFLGMHLIRLNINQ